jgi:D-alanyl-D-alanine carboxypeptidase (penicillin-binding protein 5/6)
LLKYGYAAYESKRLYAGDASVVDLRVFKGALEQVPVGVGYDLSVTLPRGSFGALQANVAVADNQVAPLHVGQTVGKLNLQYNGQPLAEYPLIVLQDVAQGSLWRRAVDNVLLLFY